MSTNKQYFFCLIFSIFSLIGRIPPVYAFYLERTIFVDTSTAISLDASVIDENGGFAYFGLASYPGKIVQINLGNAAITNSLALNAGENCLHSAVIDTKNGYSYWGTRTSPGRVIEVKLSDLSRVAAITFNSGEDYIVSAAIRFNESYTIGDAVFGTWTIPPKAVIVKLSNFSRYGAVTLNDRGQGVLNVALHHANTPDYFLFGDSSGILSALNMNTFHAGAALIYPDQKAILCGVSDNMTNGYYYFGTNQDPGRILKVYSVFNITSTLTLPPMYGSPTTAIIDIKNGFAYFGGMHTGQFVGYVVKISLNDFRVVDSLLFSSTYDGIPTTAVIDVGNGFSYWGTDSGRIIRVSHHPAPNTSNQLDKAFGFPSPFDSTAGDKNITFTNLLPNTKVQVFTLAGYPVIKLNSDDKTYVEWNVKNSSGGSIPPGTYLVRVSVGSQKKTFKIMVFKGN